MLVGKLFSLISSLLSSFLPDPLIFRVTDACFCFKVVTNILNPVLVEILSCEVTLCSGIWKTGQDLFVELWDGNL